mgnify:CR=1 FL=1
MDMKNIDYSKLDEITVKSQSELDAVPDELFPRASTELFPRASTELFPRASTRLAYFFLTTALFHTVPNSI